MANYNPAVVSAVYLPDGRSYRFYYNSYAELARVELPTGGAVEYDMNSGSGVVSGFGLYGDEKQIYRRVVERRTYADGVTLEGRRIYTASGQLRTVDHLTPAGVLLAREKHYFNGDAVQSLFAPAAGTFHSDWREGRETATEYLAADGVTVLQRVSNTWEQRAPVSWYPSLYANGGNEPASDPRVTQTVTTLVDTNQVSKKTFLYDQYNNQTDLYEYDYGAGAAGPLLRRTHTDFLTVAPVNGVDYTSNAVHIRNLPARTSVYDANGAEQARTTYEYDNYAADTYHAGLTNRPGIFGLDPAFNTAYTARGNATRVTRWLLPAGTPVSSYQQYDVAGNVVKVIDPLSNATTFDYGDRFGAPDGNAHSNTPPAELGGLSSYAFVTGATNALGQTLYGQYDYYLGRAVDGEDLNGIVATGFYNDALDRPTQVISAYGTAEQRQTSFAYDDPARAITTTGDLNGYADNLLKSQMLYDGLGRTVETRTYEAGGLYVATKQTFDAMGRASQASNSYRPGLGESPVWTTTAYDGLSRVVSVMTPDGAVSASAYSGNQTTATDQALRSRRSVADALGRLTTVFEDPNGLNYQTSYTYDALDNLRIVTQDGQTRTFVYDSLSRLTSAANPENGTVSYQYDPGSNLTQRTDARGVTTTSAYDVLNRVTSRTYNDGTPSVAYFYDSQPLPGGAPGQQPTQPQAPKPTPALILSGPNNPANPTPQEEQLITDAHAEAQRRVQENPQCANLLGGPVNAMNGLNGMIFVLDRSLTGKARPQAAVEEDEDGKPTGRFFVNPSGALMRPEGATHQFTLLQSPGETPSTLTLSGDEAGAFVILHEQAHPAGGFGKTDADNPMRRDGRIDEKKLANNYMNNYKVWKSCFSDRTPVPNSSKALPR